MWPSVAAKLPLIRRHTQVPIGVGFGIRDAASARAVARVADAVVIGSRLIEELESRRARRRRRGRNASSIEVRSALDNDNVQEAA